MADDTHSGVAPLPRLASDREIMKQALEGLRDDIASMKRSQQPPSNGHISRGQIFNGVLGALLAGAVTFGGVSYWRSSDRLNLIEETARAADRKVDQIIKDDVGRKAYVDTRLDSLALRLEPLGVMIERIQRLELGAKDFEKNLSQNREAALTANEKIFDALSASKTELALLRQELQQTRSLIEGQRPALRRPSMLWGGGTIMLAGMRQNKAQNNAEARTASDDIAASIHEDRNELAQLRGWLRSMRELIEAREPEGFEDDPADDPPPRQAGPREAEPQSKPARRAASRPRSPRKRRYLAGNSFTRALERAFGRPTFRGRYWNSLYRSGGVLK